MAATGTIALNANSLTVTGSGTKFTTEAQVGGALVTYIGNVPYTFVVGAINSDTSIILTANYQGSNVSGQSFSLIDRGAYTAITAELGARTAQAIRGLNYDKSNWQKILTGSGNVTVNVPDGSQYTGPSWLSLSNVVNGLGNSSTRNVGNTLGTVAAGDDSRLNTINNKSGGVVKGAVQSSAGGDPAVIGKTGYTGVIGSFFDQWGAKNTSFPGAGFAIQAYKIVGGEFGANLTLSSSWGADKGWTFNDAGNAISQGTWINNSDERIKTNIESIGSPLEKMTKIRGTTWTRTDFEDMTGIGFIAQSVQKVFPDSVFESGDRTLLDGTEVKGILSPDTSGVAAALHQEAILTLMSIQRKALLALSDPSLSEEDKQSALKELATLIPDESEYADQ